MERYPQVSPGVQSCLLPVPMSCPHKTVSWLCPPLLLLQEVQPPALSKPRAWLCLPMQSFRVHPNQALMCEPGGQLSLPRSFLSPGFPPLHGTLELTSGRAGLQNPWPCTLAGGAVCVPPGPAYHRCGPRAFSELGSASWVTGTHQGSSSPYMACRCPSQHGQLPLSGVKLGPEPCSPTLDSLSPGERRGTMWRGSRWELEASAPRSTQRRLQACRAHGSALQRAIQGRGEGWCLVLQLMLSRGESAQTHIGSSMVACGMRVEESQMAACAPRGEEPIAEGGGSLVLAVSPQCACIAEG